MQGNFFGGIGMFISPEVCQIVIHDAISQYERSFVRQIICYMLT